MFFISSIPANSKSSSCIKISGAINAVLPLVIKRVCVFPVTMQICAKADLASPRSPNLQTIGCS